MFDLLFLTFAIKTAQKDGTSKLCEMSVVIQVTKTYDGELNSEKNPS